MGVLYDTYRRTQKKRCKMCGCILDDKHDGDVCECCLDERNESDPGEVEE